jgi:hypothetical protein
MPYKIQPLVESDFDFSGIFAEKQESVRKATGLDFNLESVVKFLQRQTNNFTVDNQIAHDLDNAIIKIVEKYNAEKGAVETTEVKPVEEKTEEEKHQDIVEAIEILELMGDELTEEQKDALDILKTLI